MARVFWIGIPWLMILLYATLALGFASPIWFILATVALIEAGDDIIRIRDQRFEGSIRRSLMLLVPLRNR